MTNLSRRAFAFGLPAASVAATYVLSATNGVAQAGTAKAVTPLAQIKIGRFTVTALADGFADMPFSYFPGRTPEEVEAAAKAVSAAKPGGIRFVFNQYLVEDGSSRILIDAGPGRLARSLSCGPDSPVGHPAYAAAAGTSSFSPACWSDSLSPP